MLRWLAMLTVASMLTLTSVFAEIVSCGFTSQCPNGMACVGAIGTGNNGQCVLTGLKIVMCNTLTIFQKYIVVPFATLAVIGAGVGWMVGKASWGLAAGIIIGVIMAVYSNAIIARISGTTEGFCPTTETVYNSLPNCIKNKLKVSNTDYIYNVETSTNCPNYFQCVYVTSCSGYNLTFDGLIPKYNPVDIAQGTYSIDTIPSSRITVSSKTIPPMYLPPPSSIEKDNNGLPIFRLSIINTKEPYEKRTVQCNIKQYSAKADYFACENICNKSSFAAHHSVDRYDSCLSIAQGIAKSKS